MHAIEAKRPDPIGRADELAFFPPFLDDIEHGPAALLLEGDAGIGKTTVWSAGVRRARERGYRVLSCRPTESEMQLPFAAFGDLVDDMPSRAFEVLPGPQVRALDVAMLRADSEGAPVERRAIALALHGALRELAAETPVVLAVDDLQWLDAASAGAVGFALRRLESARVGVLATRRGQEAATAFADVLVAEHTTRIELPPLDADSLSRVLVDELGIRLARPALQQLYRVSAGNPFFALELARALQRRGLAPAPGQPFPVPQNLRELVRDRLEQTSAAARSTALVVAALADPTPATVERVAAAAGIAADGLEEAMASGLVELDDDRVRFSHPLLGSIIYSDASPAHRREVHQTVAGVSDDVEERAAHLGLAATTPDEGVAAALDEGALRAFGRGAPEAAAHLHERAVALTPAADTKRRFERSMAAGEARLRAGDVPSARRAFETALGIATEHHARARALTRLGSMLMLDLQPGLAASLDAYERAAQEAQGDDELVCSVELDLAWVHTFRGDRLAARDGACRAVALAERLGNEERLAHALVTAAFVAGRGPNERAYPLLDRAFSLEHRLRRHQFASRPEFIHVLFLAGDGRLDEARALCLAAYRRALDEGDEGSVPTVLEHLLIVERRAGNWEDAERYGRDMLDAAERGRFFPGYYSAPYAWLLALRGQIDEARALAAEGLPLADEGGVGAIFAGHRAVLGLIALSTGDAHSCADTLAPLSALLVPEVAETGWFRFLADEIEARLLLGQVDEAKGLVERLAERRSVLFDSAWTRAATLRCRGLVLAAEGDEPHAADAFARALQEHECLGDPFELARTLLAKGRTDRRFKRRRAGREQLEAARAIFSRLGAPLWVERSEEELRRIGGRAPRGAGLTSTEERVADLAAQGLTNREIAARLFLSVNTVQAYLKRIYRELGVRSRTELSRKLLQAETANNPDSGVSAKTFGP